MEEMLHKIHGELIEFRSETAVRAKHVQDLLSDHHETIYGDGNGRPGLRLRTDRLEQRVSVHDKQWDEQTQNKKQHFWVAWTAAITAMIAAAFSWLHRP